MTRVDALVSALGIATAAATLAVAMDGACVAAESSARPEACLLCGRPVMVSDGIARRKDGCRAAIQSAEIVLVRLPPPPDDKDNAAGYRRPQPTDIVCCFLAILQPLTESL